MDGCGLGGVCDYITHFGYHIKGVWIMKMWGGLYLFCWGKHWTLALESKFTGHQMNPTLLTLNSGNYLQLGPLNQFEVNELCQLDLINA